MVKHAVVVGASQHCWSTHEFRALARWCNDHCVSPLYQNLEHHVRQADVLVVARGLKPGFIPGDWVKPGAIVIDVGIKPSQ